MTTYPDLNDLHVMPPGLERIEAARRCITDHEDAIKEARRIRDDEVRAWAIVHGPAKTARDTGIPLPTVNVINRSR